MDVRKLSTLAAAVVVAGAALVAVTNAPATAAPVHRQQCSTVTRLLPVLEHRTTRLDQRLERATGILARAGAAGNQIVVDRAQRRVDALRAAVARASRRITAIHRRCDRTA
ncbi:MAG TPA: hypothetical protein VH986_00555 [Acidimicrobiia bacterium]|jgi:hypothetical protein